MRILSISSEAAPWSKSGGLGDVCGALPAALAARGHGVMLVTPGYRGSIPKGAKKSADRYTLHFPFGDVGYRLHALEAGRGLRAVFVDAPQYFDRAGLYGEQGGSYLDNPRRFAFFSMAALAAAQAESFKADIVHLHDWQTGLAALALSKGFSRTHLGRAKTVFTVHNLAYQGVFPKSEVDALGLPWEAFTPDGLEFHDQLCFLKAGIVYSERVTTVSPQYAKEIVTPAGGFGLQGVLQSRGAALTGILNGIDAASWDPAHDELLPARYSKDDLAGKERCAAELLRRFSLTLPPSAAGQRRPPIFGVVGRMTWQKGVEEVQAHAPSILERGGRLVVVGTGEPQYQDGWRALAAQWPGRLGVHVGFDEPLAHLVEAGSDFFLMPSRFEPCGLNQLYSQLYGTVPVVRGVGGLKDTVVDLAEPRATGIVFSGDAFAEALARAFALYRDPARLAQVRAEGMAKDYSWDASARAYEELFEALARRPAPPLAANG